MGIKIFNSTLTLYSFNLKSKIAKHPLFNRLGTTFSAEYNSKMWHYAGKSLLWTIMWIMYARIKWKLC